MWPSSQKMIWTKTCTSIDLAKTTNLADEFSDHAIPGAVWERRAVLAISDLVDIVLEAQDLGKGIQDIDREPFVSLGLAQNVLCHHNKWLFLFTRILSDRVREFSFSRKALLAQC